MAESSHRPCPGLMRVSQVLRVPRRAVVTDPALALVAAMCEAASSESSLMRDELASANANPQLRLLARTKTPDGDALLLSRQPRPAVLLRSERLHILSEAVLLRWLSGVADEGCPPRPADAQPRQTGLALAPVGDSNVLARRRGPTQVLRAFLPRLLEHAAAGEGASVERSLTTPVTGTTVAALAPPLSRAERRCVDFQVGQLLRRISLQQSPNGKFGTAVAVLSPEPTTASGSGALRKRAVAPSHLHARHDRWSDAFSCMMEAALRDAEDYRVAIRYDAVRHHVARFRRFLDAVTRPRLVAVDAGEDASTLVSPLTGAGARHDRPPALDTGSLRPDGGDGACRWTTARPARASVQVTGIRDWSNCVFGDPLFTSVLSRSVSPETWDGFRSPLRDHEPDPRPQQPLEDLASARIRRLLYECHHAVTAIVREYCRRRSDSDDREMPARKRLTQVLRTLDGLDDLGRERRPHPSAEAPPAKRPKPSPAEAAGRELRRRAARRH